jgi:hypothetical protein
MRRAALALPIALAACATGPTLTERLAIFVGKSELELVSGLGVPARSYETGGLRFLQYERRRAVAYPGTPGFGGPYGPYGRWGGWGGWGAPPMVVVSECDVTFALRAGVVESFTIRGECR